MPYGTGRKVSSAKKAVMDAPSTGRAMAKGMKQRRLVSRASADTAGQAMLRAVEEFKPKKVKSKAKPKKKPTNARSYWGKYGYAKKN